MIETQTHQRFRSRIEYLDLFLTAMDAAARVTLHILDTHKTDRKNISSVLPVDCRRYIRLNHPVDQRNRIFNYCSSQNAIHAIIELYTIFTEYIRGALLEMYHFKPLLVVGKSKKTLDMTFTDIAKIASLADLQSYMVDRVFRSLEDERSTSKLVDAILKGTGAKITPAIYKDLFPYMEMRHLFVHAQGQVDAPFQKNYGAQFGTKCGDKLPSDFKTSSAAIASVVKFVDELDKELIRVGLAKQKP